MGDFSAAFLGASSDGDPAAQRDAGILIAIGALADVVDAILHAAQRYAARRGGLLAQRNAGTPVPTLATAQGVGHATDWKAWHAASTGNRSPQRQASVGLVAKAGMSIGDAADQIVERHACGLGDLPA